MILLREWKKSLQAYLEECKYKIKKMQMPRFINTELKSDSDSDSEAESENDWHCKLMIKLKSNSE